jgi:hypothetical protein
MKAIEILKKYKDEIQTSIPSKIDLNEAIEELEFYLSKRNSYPPCDACGKEVDYMPWHYSTEKERHLHSCDECWESIKDKFTLKG